MYRRPCLLQQRSLVGIDWLSLVARQRLIDSIFSAIAWCFCVRMHYLDRGPQTGIPLIWANGTYSNAHELDLVSDSLLSAGLRLITIDCCGHGLTPRGDHPVSIYHVADDMAFLLDHLGITKLTGAPLSSSASA